MGNAISVFVVDLENLEVDHTAAKTAEIRSNEFAKHGFDATSFLKQMQKLLFGLDIRKI